MRTVSAAILLVSVFGSLVVACSSSSSSGNDSSLFGAGATNPSVANPTATTNRGTSTDDNGGNSNTGPTRSTTKFAGGSTDVDSADAGAATDASAPSDAGVQSYDAQVADADAPLTVDASVNEDAGSTLTCAQGQIGSVDQTQLVGDGDMGLSLTQIPGESFTVGTSGTLSGIEIAIGPCNGASTAGTIQLEIFDGSNTSLGSVSLQESSLPSSCGGYPMTADTIGAGYFDLTPLCLPVIAGEQLKFVLTLHGSAPGTCDEDTRVCSNSGRDCEEDFECQDFYYVGMTNCGGTGCDTSSSRYPGGNLLFQDATSGAITDQSAFELAFKTFVE